MRTPVRAWAAVAALVLAAASPARAQPDQARKEAAAHFGTAVALFEAHDFAAALEAFRSAYDAAPSYEVLWNIGLCQRRLFLYGDAVATFEAYLKEGGKRLSKERRAAVADELAKVRSLTAAVTVRAPVVAEVQVDGERVGFTPLERHLLGPGPHTVKVVREGHQTFEQTKTLASGDHLILQPELPSIAGGLRPRLEPLPRSTPVGPAEKVKAREAADPARAPSVSAWGIASLAAGAAFLGGGIAFESSARLTNAEISQFFKTGGTWDQSWVEKQQWTQTARGLAVFSFIVGSALAGTGAVITAFTATQRAPPPTLTVAPGPGGVWVSLSGVF